MYVQESQQKFQLRMPNAHHKYTAKPTPCNALLLLLFIIIIRS